MGEQSKKTFVRFKKKERGFTQKKNLSSYAGLVYLLERDDFDVGDFLGVGAQPSLHATL